MKIIKCAKYVLLSLLFYVLNVLIYLVLNGCVSYFYQLFSKTEYATYDIYLNVISLCLSAVIFERWVLRANGIAIADSLQCKNIKARHFILFALYGILAGVAVNGIIELLFPASLEDAVVMNIGQVIVYILYTIALAPFVEEMIFRVFLMGRLSNVLKKRNAVLISSIVFALVHFNLIQIPYTLIMGIVYGTVAMKTRNVIRSVMLHAGFNMGAVILSVAGMMCV